MTLTEMVSHPLYKDFKKFACNYYGDVADGSTFFSDADFLNEFAMYVAGYNAAIAELRASIKE